MVIEQKFKEGEEPDPSQYLYVSLEQKRIDQTKPYDAKKACWVPCEKEGFVQGELISQTEKDAKVKVGGEEKTFKAAQVGQVNPPKYEKSEDMSNLTYLNDASVLHNLKQRYYNQLIYTYSGLFCIAINPYKRYPIYTQRAMKIYNGKRRNEVPPHIFAIAEGAYQNMCTDNENQSILITGESGAGKTENTKKVIAYFASVGATSTGKGKDGEKKLSLEDQIVQTNPVLEAFGNAKTTRNDNSSRFGKFIRIHFGSSGKLAGADIETYLLEKARVISQQPLERSYHIFYQIMTGKVPGIKEMCLLSNDIYEYNYVSQGKITVPSIDDNEELVMTHEAFEILGFTNKERENIYKITAAVMHLGTMKFKGKDQAEADGTSEGEKVGKLLGIDGEGLYKSFTSPKIKVGTEFVTKAQTPAQCNYTVGAMAKAAFDRLFTYLVVKCNHTLDTQQRRDSFAGVLDIAGFEIFDYNGFEQLCINFTNEKLQQFFNHHMFVLEQEEYKKEGLDWIFEDFGMDLQACIELMEKPLGVMSILEEQSMFPKATDQTFADMLRNNHLGKSNIFIKPRPPKPGVAEAHFALVHYAGTVAYSITGWLEKNKDPLNDTVVDQFKKGSNQLLCDIFANHPGQSGPPQESKGGGKKKGTGFATVSSSYREQLNNLMTTLKATHPHFIRCIIPNEVKTPGLIDSGLVMHQLTCNGVLEGIRICRKGFPNRMLYPDFKHRYIILAAQVMNEEKDDKKMATACFDSIGLDKEKYRVGHTKVFFRAGILGELEEIRDDRLSRIIANLQSTIRAYNTRKSYKQLADQRVALEVVQRAVRSWVRNRTWPWMRFWKLIKPKLNVTRVEDEIKRLNDLFATAEEGRLKEEVARKAVEVKCNKVQKENNEILSQLEASKGGASSLTDKLHKLQSQKSDLEGQLHDVQNRLGMEEDARNQLNQQKRKIENEVKNMHKEFEELSGGLERSSGDKATKEAVIKNLNEEIAHQEELIQKLNKEKKAAQEMNQKASEDLQALEDKVNHFSKVKAKQERSLDEIEDNLEREKKIRGDVEKAKRKVEGDLKLTQEAVVELERNNKELEQGIQRKDKELGSLTAKMEDEQGLFGKLQRQIKELQGRIEELCEELDEERASRGRAEKNRSNLATELGDLCSRLEEAGGATSNQIGLNKKREAELAKLRHDVEEANINHEGSMANLRKKHNDAVTEMAEQIDNLSKVKAKAEKDRSALEPELRDLRAAMDHLASDKSAQEKLGKHLNQQVNELQVKFDEIARNLGEADMSRKKMSMENTDMSRQLEEGENQLSQLNKLKVSLHTQLEDTKRLADEEGREKATLLGKFRNVEHDLDALREQLEESAEGKSEILRQISKANGEAQLWRAKYESEGLARTEELEEAKRKLQARLAEAEETIESLSQKAVVVEKGNQKLSANYEQMANEVEKARVIAGQGEKKQKYFDKIVGEWKLKVEDLQAEVDASGKEARNYSSEVFRTKAMYEEGQEQLSSVRRENKNLVDEIKDLLEQIGEGSRNVHEIEKARKRLEMEKEELQSALEGAEVALEQEENKVLRGQLELSQVRQEIDRRLGEKEEEFENTRRNHHRALESMQASLEAEVKGKAEAIRMKKALETSINELEIGLDHSNKANAESQKAIKRYLVSLKEVQTALEEEVRGREEARELLGTSERKGNARANELEESRTLLEQADRARRSAEQDLNSAHEQLNELSNQTSNLANSKRKLETELTTLHTDLEEILNEAKNSEEKAKKAMVDASRLADELRVEQEHTQNAEKTRKALECQLKDLQSRLDEAEANSLKGGKKAIQKIEDRVRGLESELDAEQRRTADDQKNLRKGERRIKELAFQAEEDRKNQERMADLVDKLQQKIKTYKRQIEEAEEIAALNLAKFRKAQGELEEADERSEVAEQMFSKVRARGSVPPSLF